MAVSLTSEQQSVVDAKTADILVAAAAGSGKTAVLVERILKKIMDEREPVNIDEFLIVTFTNDAATQMRDRIRRAIDERLTKEPENERLILQSERLNFASIMTLDSFCQSAVRRYFHVLNIDPGFRILDDTDRKMLWKKAMEETIEAWHEEGREDFFRLLEMYATKRSDQTLQNIVDEICRFADSSPFPEEWIEQSYSYLLSIQTEEDLLGSTYANSAYTFMMNTLPTHREQLIKLIRLAELPDGPVHYASVLREDLDLCEKMMASGSFSGIAKFLTDVKFPAIPSKKGVFLNREYIKDSRNAILDVWKAWKKQYFSMSFPDQLSILQNAAASMKTLGELCIASRQRYEAFMKEENAYDFASVEHMTLKLFLTKDEDGNIGYSEVSKQYRSLYKEIMVDEYQDSNLVQELFLKAVSSGEEGKPNMFMVGDIKQSIYKFRLARPELFMEKFDSFLKEADAKQRLILLTANFRSRESVIEGINQVFRMIMHKELGGVEYDTDAELHYRAGYQHTLSEEEATNEVLIVPKEEDMDAGIHAIINRIKELTDPIHGFPVTEKDHTRIAGYGDIAIICRTMTKLAYPLIEALMDAGIPAYAAKMTGYFSTSEVRNVLNLIRVLDNPLQDIPFAAALQSPIGGFDYNDLSMLRILAAELAGGGKTDYLYQVLLKLRDMEYVKECYYGIREKGNAFLDLLAYLRKKKLYLSVPQLITELYRVTGYLSYVSVMPAGIVRERNLNMLVEKAKAFAGGLNTELSDFVRYIDDMIRYDANPEPELSENGNAVRVMTIHKSKGLEFPIVFLIDADREMNSPARNVPVKCHSDLGFGPKSLYPETRQSFRTFARDVIEERIKDDEKGEALRLLYVAMTRAKEKLIVVAEETAKSFSDYLVNIPSPGASLGYERVSHAKTYMDLIMPCILSELPQETVARITPIDHAIWVHFEPVQGGFWRIIQTKKAEEVRAGSVAEAMEGSETDGYDELEKYFTYSYPFNRNNTPVKVSVSALKHSAMEEYAINHDHPAVLIEHAEENPAPVPTFIDPDAKSLATPAGAIRGTMYHRILELHDYKRDGSEADSREEALALLQKGYVPEEMLSSVSFDKLSNFYCSELGLRMKKAFLAGKLKREQPFVMRVSAATVSKDYDPEETVLVQGIIDAFFEEDGEYVLLDYKTDRVPVGDDGSFLINRYKTQLDYYAKAIERGTGILVKEIYIYSFALQKIVRL